MTSLHLPSLRPVPRVLGLLHKLPPARHLECRVAAGAAVDLLLHVEADAAPRLPAHRQLHRLPAHASAATGLLLLQVGQRRGRHGRLAYLWFEPLEVGTEAHNPLPQLAAAGSQELEQRVVRRRERPRVEHVDLESRWVSAAACTRGLSPVGGGRPSPCLILPAYAMHPLSTF